MYALYGRIEASCYGNVGGIVRVGFSTFKTKQEGRAAKHMAIRNQNDQICAPTYFVAKVENMGF
jgi:hypothetical protein